MNSLVSLQYIAFKLLLFAFCYRGGHQDAITGIDSHIRESCITSGGRDQSIIVYVIIEDKQLRFISPHESADGVKLLDERTFVTFGQEG